jgi:hypothetical protein
VDGDEDDLEKVEFDASISFFLYTIGSWMNEWIHEYMNECKMNCESMQSDVQRWLQVLQR